jgi:hypothetical protein
LKGSADAVGTGLDRERLISPYLARAGFDAAHVLEDIRLTREAFGFGGFAVYEIGWEADPWRSVSAGRFGGDVPTLPIHNTELRDAMHPVGTEGKTSNVDGPYWGSYVDAIAMNYRFNIDEWMLRFPLQPEYDRYTGMFVASPSQICNNEQLRRAAHDQYDWGPAVPVDVFIMADGEPPDRHVTKVGGLPYRPAALDWPRGDDGSPLTFLAQFDFTDSFDIVGRLPGDVLLVFTPDNNDEGPIESLQFEWQALGMTDLIAAGHVPVQPWRFKPCYGHRFRTVSFPDAIRKPELAESRYPTCRGLEIWSDYHLLQYQAMQIGKAPFFIQRGDEDLPGDMLCTINTICVDGDSPYPFVNRPEPLPRLEVITESWGFTWTRRPEPSPPDEPSDYLATGDAGCIYVSIDDTGRFHSNMSCY